MPDILDSSGYDSTEHQKKIEQKYADKLSVGEYLKKDVIGSFISLGSMALGAFGGYHLGKSRPGTFKIGSGPAEFELDRSLAYAFIGAMVGGMIGGIASTYNMWKKKEASQLAVQELTADVAGMTAIRAKTNPDMVREMDSLRGMYDEVKTENDSLRAKLGIRQKDAPGKQALERGARSAVEHAETDPATPEAAR